MLEGWHCKYGRIFLLCGMMMNTKNKIYYDFVIFPSHWLFCLLLHHFATILLPPSPSSYLMCGGGCWDGAHVIDNKASSKETSLNSSEALGVLKVF